MVVADELGEAQESGLARVQGTKRPSASQGSSQRRRCQPIRLPIPTSDKLSRHLPYVLGDPRPPSTDSDRVRTAGFQIPGPGMLSVCLGRLLTQGVQVRSE